MGVWGTGVSSNDTYADVYDTFVELYNEGRSPADITAFLIESNKETIEMYEDAPNFWYAVANAQWECKALQEDILNKVKSLIESGEDLRIWEELGATKSDLTARNRSLKKFLSKLQSDRPKPKTRKKKKYYNSVFTKGDCLTYKMTNGNYGGAFVLTDEVQTELGKNYIAITMIDSVEKPVLEDFADAEILVQIADEYRFEGPGNLIVERVDQPQIAGFYASVFKQEEIEVIGNIQIQKEYVVDRIVSFRWKALQTMVPSRAQYEANNGKPTTRLFVSEWISKPTRDSFWSRLFRR